MKPLLMAIASATMLAGVAQAQTPDRGDIEGFAQSAFGNVTSQSYGVEFGATIKPTLQVYGEFGQIRDVADTTFTTSASTIANALAQVQSAAVGFTAKRPVVFGTGGIKYRPATTMKVQPYVLGGFGFAQVKNDVTFTLGGTEATDSALAPYVTLGSDLSGSSTVPMLTLGAGATVPLWRTLVLDLQYRFGRLFTEDEGISTNRAGVGFGVRF
jgi:opacity protein-like surface antigen